MITVIISDIHNKVSWIEKGLDRLKDLVNYDEVVFLGDYFDNFGDGGWEAGATAAWLKQSLTRPDRIHLIGNHDMPYMITNNGSLWCPGFTTAKCNVIRDTMGDLWYKLKPAYFTQGQLLSHAGFHPHLVIHPIRGFPTPEEMVNMAERGLNILKAGGPHFLYLPGDRLSEPNIGGITWADWYAEFEPIEGVNQIVGHTPGDKVRQKLGDNSINYCMDTHSQHIGIIRDGVVSFVLRSQTLGF